MRKYQKRLRKKSSQGEIAYFCNFQQLRVSLINAFETKGGQLLPPPSHKGKKVA
jgi:hypothetical protein